MREKVFLFYGFGSEYVLHLLYKEMKDMGLNCIEIDALKIRNSKKEINKLIGKKVFLITSAHILLDKINFSYLYPTSNVFYGILETIQILKPKYSVYIPHDLIQPLTEYEDAYINQFDLFLSPCQPFTSSYKEFCKTTEVGWIKFNKNRQGKNKNTIFFVSDFILFLKLGKKKTYKTFAPVLKQGVAIKFPDWPGSKEFEDLFKKRGAKVYPSSVNSIDLILDHQSIITNGVSSIIAESYYLGKTTINLLLDKSKKEKEFLAKRFPELIFVEDIKKFNLSKISSTKNKRVLKTFQLKDVANLLVNKSKYAF